MALKSLECKGYIEWKRKNIQSIKIIKAWEESPKNAITNTLMGRM